MASSSVTVCSGFRDAPGRSTTRPASMESCTAATTSRSPSRATKASRKASPSGKLWPVATCSSGNGTGAGQNALRARCSSTAESLPPENSSTGRADSATTSRMTCTASDSSTSRCDRRRLVRVVHPGQAAQLAGALPGVETLDVAVAADLGRRAHVHLHERRPAVFVLSAHGRPRPGVRRHDRDQHQDAVAGQQVGDVADPADVLVPVGAAEAEVSAEVGADGVAVEHLHPPAGGAQAAGRSQRDGGLASAGQAGQPDSGAGGRHRVDRGTVDWGTVNRGCPGRHGALVERGHEGPLVGAYGDTTAKSEAPTARRRPPVWAHDNVRRRWTRGSGWRRGTPRGYRTEMVGRQTALDTRCRSTCSRATKATVGVMVAKADTPPYRCRIRGGIPPRAAAVTGRVTGADRTRSWPRRPTGRCAGRSLGLPRGCTARSRWSHSRRTAAG